jgi:hypothetical protein
MIGRNVEPARQPAFLQAARLSAPMRHVETDHGVQKTRKSSSARADLFRRSTSWQRSVFGLCISHGISWSLFYKLLRIGKGPRVIKCGRRTLISVEAAQAWRRARERLALSTRQGDRAGPTTQRTKRKRSRLTTAIARPFPRRRRASRAIRDSMGGRCTSIHSKSATCKIKAVETIDRRSGRQSSSTPTCHYHPQVPRRSDSCRRSRAKKRGMST